MSGLPQELIDKIIDEVSQYGSAHDLRACCLVQKRWVERSRGHLFKKVSLCAVHHVRDWRKLVPPGARNHFRDWVELIRPGHDGPSHHVRSLLYCQDWAALGPEQLLNLYPGHFTSFTDLESLHIHRLSLGRFTATSMQKAFGPIGRRIRTLVVEDVLLTLNSLLMFLAYFPRLETLNLGDDFSTVPEKKERPQSLPRFTGELVLICMGSMHIPFVLELSKLPLRYSELDIEFVWNSKVLHAVRHLILTCSPILEKLTLRYAYAPSDEDVDEAFPLDFKHCSLLRKVAVQVPHYKAQEHLARLVGTVRSHKLDTIEFIGAANRVRLSTWATVDDELCAWVDRLEEDGWKGKLQVLIHYSESKRDPFEEGRLLTRFRSKGSGEVVESVDNHLNILIGVRLILNTSGRL